ncbi:hypothetical protein L873DRAFT_1874343, partial [Choiromyces venosus 120613-1]
LLLLDRHVLHCTRGFITFCDERKIILFCLPSHTTNLIQPLDVVVFQPLKHFYAEAIDRVTWTGYPEFNKIEFLSDLTSIWDQAFKKTTILLAFQKTGLISYDPRIVLSQLPKYHISEDTLPLRTPPLMLLPCLSTPVTVRSLKCRAQYLKDADLVSPTFKPNLKQFVKGSLAQVQLGAHASQELANTKAAEQVRATQQNHTCRYVRKGGVVYMYQARVIACKKEEDDTQKKIENAEWQLEKVKREAIWE